MLEVVQTQPEAAPIAWSPEMQPLAAKEPDIQEDVEASGEELSTLSSEEVRESIIKLRDDLAHNYVELCKLLWTVSRKEYHKAWGFPTFKEYIAREIEFKITKARYLVQMWDSLYVKQTDKTVFDKVMSVGWTKAKELCNVVTAENVDDWVQKAKDYNVETLIKEVKHYVKSKIPDDPTKALEKAGEVEGTNVENEMKSMSFQFFYDDFLAIGEALDKVKAMQPGISSSQALGLICRDFSGTNQAEGEKSDIIVEFLAKYEKIFNYKIVVIDGDGEEILHGYEHLEAIAKRSKAN